MDYEVIDGTEEARLLRDRLRGLEQRHVQARAAKLAGDEGADREVESLEERMDALNTAIKEAEERD